MLETDQTSVLSSRIWNICRNSGSTRDSGSMFSWDRTWTAYKSVIIALRLCAVSYRYICLSEVLLTEDLTLSQSEVLVNIYTFAEERQLVR